MKRECSIIRDLLPLYAEHMVSPETAAFVEEHLQGCGECRKEYETVKEPPPPPLQEEAAPLRILSRKLKANRLKTALMAACFVAALLIGLFAAADTPRFFPYSPGVVTLEPLGEQEVLVTFGPGVTGYRCRVTADPEVGSRCEIEAWSSLWEQWFSPGNKTLSARVDTQNEEMLFSYLPNDGSESRIVGHFTPGGELDTAVKTDQGIALPRLALNYYLILAIAALFAAAVVWLCVRKHRSVRIWVERVGLYPVSYLVGHFAVAGCNGATNSITRDLFLILLVSLFFYLGLLLAHSLLCGKLRIRTADPQQER